MKQTEFKKRRKQLMQQIGKGNIGLIASASTRTRNRDVDYPFRQDSDFYYLTGFNEPEALAVFIPGRTQGQYLLFCREYDEKKALWEGAHAGLGGATRDYGAKTRPKCFIRWVRTVIWIIIYWIGCITCAASRVRESAHRWSWCHWNKSCMKCA
jgi:Xaa-Pro aminopeptidase